MNRLLVVALVLSVSSLHGAEFRARKGAVKDLPLFDFASQPNNPRAEAAMREALLRGDLAFLGKEIQRQGLNGPPHRDKLEEVVFRRARFLLEVEEAGDVEAYLAFKNAGQVRSQSLAKEHKNAAAPSGQSNSSGNDRQMAGRLKRKKAYNQLAGQLEFLASLGGGESLVINKPMRRSKGVIPPRYFKTTQRTAATEKAPEEPGPINWDKFVFWAQRTKRRFGSQLVSKRFILESAGMPEIDVGGELVPINDARVTGPDIDRAFAYYVDEAVRLGKMPPLPAAKTFH